MIRKATVDDVDNIYSLYKENCLDSTKISDRHYATNIQKDGFILALEDKNDILERIKTNFIYNVFEQDNQIIGFVNVNKEIYFPEDADNIIWFSEELKKSYFHSESSITFHEIVVAKEHRTQGIARQLLQACLKTLQERGYTDLFSIVAFAPLTNCASVLFHSRNGFERACVSMPFDLFGLKNYQSVLYHLQIR